MESFWSTEYGQNLLSVEQTEIDKLLSSPNDTTLEDLFDEDELLQQCSNKNSQLINFLSKQENITKLVSYITRPWQEHMQQIINHLEQKQKQQKQQEEQDQLTQSIDEENSTDSPLSKNNQNRVGSIKEEDTDDANDSNTTTPQALADALMSLEQIGNNNQDDKDTKDTENKEHKQENKASNIFDQIINDNIPQEEDNNDIEDKNKDNNDKEENQQKKKDDDTIIDTKNDDDDNEEDEFNRYDDLKLSDDDEEENIDNNDESNKDENDKDPSNPPKLKKKGSIVDMLMAGPGFEDDTELDTNNNSNDQQNDDNNDKNDNDNTTNNIEENNDADPELPDLDVKKENDKDSSLSPNSSNSSTDSTSSSDDNIEPTPSQPTTTTLIYDEKRDDIPPPPPPPTQPTKLDEFKSEIGEEKVKLKYPYLASEIINCQIPQILDTILNINNPFLDMLFDFIEQEAPLNAVLTNYWRSCIVGLVRRNSDVILSYIKSRKNLLSSLVQHIRDQSIMELVIALGWDPAIEELKELDEVADWMYQQQLVPKLIATLSPTRTPDEHSAASYTLVDIVAKTSRSTNLVLFHNLASAEQIDGLMNHMFAGNRSSLLESLSVLLALLHHYPNVSAEKQQFGDDEMEANNDDTQNTQNTTDIPPPPPQPPVEPGIPSPPSSDTELTRNPLAPKQSISDDIGAAENNVNPLAVLAMKQQKDKPDVTNNTDNDENKDNKDDKENQQPQQQQQEEEKEEKEELEFEENIPAVVRAVCYRLKEFKLLLETAPSTSLKLPFVDLNPPLGPVRHKVVDMIVALMRTPSRVVSKKLRELGLIKICINLFFEYPWNNLLHGSVEHIIQMVVSGDCSILKKALFEDCDFLNRILKARELSATHQEEKKFRLGYMGHITRVSNTIVEFAKRNEQLEGYMNENEKWMKFIGDDLKLENEQLNTQLGGHRPTTLNDDDNDDFTLFTLNDITNNNDAEEVDLLGGNYGDDGEDGEEEDRDSDSDEDEEEVLMTGGGNNDNDETKKNDDYEMPQDAFSRLTQTIDELHEQNDDKKEDKTEDKNRVNGDKPTTNDDFDNWFSNNDDNDNWFDNGGVNDDKKETEKQEDDKDKINGDSKQNEQEQDKNGNVDDFDNWDNDPFGDDLFGTDNNDQNGNNKNDDKPPEVMTTDPNEDGLEIPDSLTPSPRPNDNNDNNDNQNENDKDQPNGHKSDENNGNTQKEEVVNDKNNTSSPPKDIQSNNNNNDNNINKSSPSPSQKQETDSSQSDQTKISVAPKKVNNATEQQQQQQATVAVTD